MIRLSVLNNQQNMLKGQFQINHAGRLPTTPIVLFTSYARPRLCFVMLTFSDNELMAKNYNDHDSQSNPTSGGKIYNDLDNQASGQKLNTQNSLSVFGKGCPDLVREQ